MSTRMLLVLFCLVCVTTARAGLSRVKLHLPPGVEYQGISEANGHLEIKLSLSAFQSQVRADRPAAIGMRDNSCLILIPVTGGELPALSRIPVAAGPVVVELIDDPAPGAGDAGTGNPPVAPKPPGSPSTPDAPPGPGVSPPVAIGVARAVDPVADTMNDLIGKALGTLNAGAVKFDPVAMADYAIPASAAATVIGSSSTLTRPAAPREVVTGLLSDFDQDGRLQAGFSIAITPYTLLRKMPLTAEEYQQDPFKRFLANLQLSLAARTDEGIVTGGEKAARFGGGLSMVLFDKGDLRLDNDFLTKLMGKVAGHFTSDEVNESTGYAPTPPEILKAAGKFWADEKARRWNAASAGFGVAPAFLSLSGKLSDAKDDGVMTWVNFALPGPGALEESTQFILGGNARFRQRVQVDSAWTRADVLDFGAQLRYGGAAGNFFAEGQYRRRDGGAATTEKFVYEVGLERRLKDNVWLNLSWTNDDAIQGGQLIRTGLRYGFGEKAVNSPLKN